MHCLKASRVKAGSVTAQINVQFKTAGFQNFSYSYQKSLFVDLTHKETCRAQAGLGGNVYGEYVVRGMPCDKKHLYGGLLNGDFIYLNDTDGQETPFFFVGELFGSAKLPYFENSLNAYGRKAKAYYETADGIKELQRSNASGCFIGGPSIPGVQQTLCTVISFAIGNGIEYSSSGLFTVQDWYQPDDGPGYWINTYFPFNYQAHRTIQNLENYGD
jgi:hypothetical protein